MREDNYGRESMPLALRTSPPPEAWFEQGERVCFDTHLSPLLSTLFPGVLVISSLSENPERSWRTLGLQTVSLETTHGVAIEVAGRARFSSDLLHRTR